MNKNKVICTLNLTERDNFIFSDMRKEMIEEDICNLPNIYKGESKIDKIYIYKDDFGIEINVIIRNATSENISYDMLPLVLKNKDGRVVASKMFTNFDLMDIIPNGARPYSFRFENEYIYDSNIDFEQCVIEESNDMDDFKYIKLDILSIPEYFSKEEILNLNRKAKVVNGQLQMVPIEFGTDTNGTPYAIIMINNGTRKMQEISKIPLTIKDANDKLIISDWFKVDISNIKPLMSTVYTLYFHDKKIDENKDKLTGVKIIFGVK